jgi:hemolysin activation/secretion protein
MTVLAPINRLSRVAATLAVMSGMAAGSASAQDDARVAPKAVPQQAGAGSIETPPMPKAKPQQDDRVLIKDLKGLVLINSAAKVKAGVTGGPGIAVYDLPKLDDPIVRDRLQAFIGKPLTRNGIHALGQVIITWYREKKYPFVDVAVPAGEDVTNGVVQVVVTESRAGKVTARGNRWFSSDFLVSQVRLAPGDPINLQKLEDDKNWINQNPFRLVNIVAYRSDEPGVTDLVVDTVQEKFPLRVYAGYDNTGTPIIGHDRWNLGFNWGDALWLDGQFGYQFTSSDNFWHSRAEVGGSPGKPNFESHSITYEIPLPWRDKLTFYALYIQDSPRLGPDIGLTGTDGVLGARYTWQLSSTREFDQDLQFGFEFKSSNNDLNFGGFAVSNITTEVDQFLVAYDAILRDDWGQTIFQNTLTFSPGGLSGDNNDRLFEAQVGPYTKASYLYDHVVITRITGVPQGSDLAQSMGWFKDISSITKFVGQVANGDLLPSEDLGAGGVDSVRGYDERVLNGSNGILLSEEVRSPTFSLSKLIDNSDSAWNDQTQLAAFWDYGSVHDVRQFAGSVDGELQSVGLGLHVLSGPDQNIRFDLNYGWQLRKLPGASDTSQFGHVALTLAY